MIDRASDSKLGPVDPVAPPPHDEMAAKRAATRERRDEARTAARHRRWPTWGKPIGASALLVGVLLGAVALVRYVEPGTLADYATAIVAMLTVPLMLIAFGQYSEARAMRRASVRPWLLVAAVEFPRDEFDHVLDGRPSLILRNCGQAPALDVRVSLGAHCPRFDELLEDAGLGGALDPSKDDSTAEKAIKGSGIVAPGADHRVWLGEAAPQATLKRSWPIVLYGTVTYRDQFGDRRSTRFRWEYHPAYRGDWHACDEGNEAE